MTDDEIVALAAKAYGDAPLGFSPLTDDGDALRLAVKLQVSVTMFEDAIGISYIQRPDSPKYEEYQIDSDPYAATREAIVRAAAEIGRNMP